MTIVKRLGLLLLLVLLLLLAVLAYVTMTHGGMQRLFSLGQSYVAGELTVGSSTGSLVGPAAFKDIAYFNDSGASVKIDEAQFDWQPRKLLRRTLLVDDFTVRGIDVHLPPPSQEETESQPFQLRDLALPLKADIKNFHVEALNIYPHGATEPVVVKEIKLSATGEESTLRLVDLNVDSPQLRAMMSGSLDTSGDWPIDLMLEWQFSHEQFGDFEGSGVVNGDTKVAEVSHQITGHNAAGEQPLSVMVEAEVMDVTAEVSWRGNVKAQADDLGLFAPAAADVPLSLDAQTEGSLQDYTLQGTLQTDHTITGEVNSKFDVQGDLQNISMQSVELTFEDSPSKVELQGSVALADLQSDITVSWEDLRWPLSENTELLTQSPSGQLKISGVPDDLKIVADSGVTQPGVGEIGVAADLVLNREIVRINQLQLDSGGADYAVDVSGEVNLEQSEVALDGKLHQLNWPLSATSETAVLHIASGNFSARGPLDQYQLTADIQMEGAQIPSGDWQLSASGDQQQLQDIVLRGQTLDGEINGSGEVAWAPQPGWSVKLNGAALNPAVKWPELPGAIGFAASAEGELGSEGLSATAVIADVSGSYRSQPLSGSGVVAIDKGITTVDNFTLNAGDASVITSGTIGEQLDLQWRINMPSVGKLVPNTDGSVVFNGVVTGAAATPSAEFSVGIDKLTAGTVVVGSGSGDGTVDLSGQQKSTVKLELDNISVAGQSIDQVNLSGQGTPTDHRVVLTTETELAELVLNATGGVNDGAWQGSVEQLDVTETQFGNWALKQAVPVSISASSVDAEDLCLSSSPSQICVDAAWDQSTGVASSVAIQSLDTLRFDQYLPPDIELDALVDGSIDIAVPTGGTPQVSGALSTSGGQLDYLDAGEPRSATLGDNQIDFELAGNNLTSSVDLDLGPIGTVSTNTTIAGLSGERALSGSVKTDIKDLAPFSAFAPGLDSFKGSLNTSMELAGSIDAPKLIGGSDLDALVLEVPSVAMKMIDGKIIAKSDGKGGLNLSGSAASGDGEVTLRGKMDPTSGGFDVTVKGENFMVANAKNQRLIVDPDLRITRRGEDISITGKVHVPTAFYQTGSEAALVRESPDVVLVNSDTEVVDNNATSQMTVNVEVTLGDDIRVKAGPFDGALAGALTVEQLPDGVPTGVGAIEVLSGDFVVYGQKLTMENGRILFGGGPVTNPALEIDVARDVPAYEVKAGAKVRGTAQAPILELQSEPPQTDANTLSYILLGRPMEGTGVSYTLGKFLTPDLYVSYGIDLVNKTETYNLRYTITELLSLIAAKSNEVSSADLIYTFER